MSDPRIGTEIAGYRVERVIGHGGMSTVYLAQDARLHRRVALKVLSTRLEQEEAFRDRFTKESRIAAGLDHPHIIPIYAAGEADGVLFIAMRYVETTDLRALVKKEAPLDPVRTILLLDQVASALDAAHTRGLVHRDVKPANVLIETEGPVGDHCYLSDFGLTKRALSTGGLTATGQFIGTLEYASPEQIRGKSLDGRADQYSLACMLYECLTGDAPFERDDEVATIYAHLTEPPPAITEKRPELGTALDHALTRALAKEPEHRYASCREFIEATRQALGFGVGPSRLIPARPAAPAALDSGADITASRLATRMRQAAWVIVALVLSVLPLANVGVALLRADQKAVSATAGALPESRPFSADKTVRDKNDGDLVQLDVQRARVEVKGSVLTLSFDTYAGFSFKNGATATWQFDTNDDADDGCQGFDLMIEIGESGGRLRRFGRKCIETSSDSRSVRTKVGQKTTVASIDVGLLPRSFKWQLSTLGQNLFWDNVPNGDPASFRY